MRRIMLVLAMTTVMAALLAGSGQAAWAQARAENCTTRALEATGMATAIGAVAPNRSAADVLALSILAQSGVAALKDAHAAGCDTSVSGFADLRNQILSTTALTGVTPPDQT